MPADDSDSTLADVFADVQSLLLAVGSLDVFLSELAGVAAKIMPDTSCGITLQREGEATTVASSDARARSMDETQYEVGEGPCLHSMRSGEVVEMTDLETDPRWPPYTERARRRGLRSSLSLPLELGASSGAMNLYSFAAADSFTRSRRHQLELLAAQASGAVRLASRRLADVETRRHLERALDSRAVIDQALGILMAQQSCSSEMAFDLLRRQSQNVHRPLRDVATDLIVRVTGEPPRPGKPFQE
jgi:GAF domain-containing protein